MRFFVAIVLSACCVIGSGASQNQATIELKAEYDTSTVVTLTGNIAQIDALGADASIMLMTRVPGSGAWAIEGDSRAALERAGWTFGAEDATVPANTEATVSVYLPFQGSPAQARLAQLIQKYPPEGLANRTHNNLVTKQRFLYGIELTLADGRKLPFGSRR